MCFACCSLVWVFGVWVWVCACACVFVLYYFARSVFICRVMFFRVRTRTATSRVVLYPLACPGATVNIRAFCCLVVC